MSALLPAVGVWDSEFSPPPFACPMRWDITVKNEQLSPTLTPGSAKTDSIPAKTGSTWAETGSRSGKTGTISGETAALLRQNWIQSWRKRSPFSAKVSSAAPALDSLLTGPDPVLPRSGITFGLKGLRFRKIWIQFWQIWIQIWRGRIPFWGVKVQKTGKKTPFWAKWSPSGRRLVKKRQLRHALGHV